VLHWTLQPIAHKAQILNACCSNTLHCSASEGLRAGQSVQRPVPQAGLRQGQHKVSPGCLSCSPEDRPSPRSNSPFYRTIENDSIYPSPRLSFLWLRNTGRTRNTTHPLFYVSHPYNLTFLNTYRNLTLPLHGHLLYPVFVVTSFSFVLYLSSGFSSRCLTVRSRLS
jgi:hypothetical protein